MRKERTEEEKRDIRHWAMIRRYCPRLIRRQTDESVTWCDLQRTPFGRTEKLLNAILDGKTRLVMDLNRPKRDIADEAEAEEKVQLHPALDRDHGDTESIHVREGSSCQEDTLPLPD